MCCLTHGFHVFFIAFPLCEVVMALCCALLAEVLRRRADEDNVIFGDPAEFKRIVEESQVFFQRASALDPSDEYSSYHAFFLGPEKQT